MARRNLASRADIPADALRQRRDLYALAIGLELYNLAGGKLMANTTFGNLLPLSLSDPHYLLWAAWVGFVYFWFRFWLISEAKPVADFIEDVRWQAGDSAAVRRIAISLLKARSNEEAARFVDALTAQGIVPKIIRAGRAPTLSLNSLRSRSSRNPGAAGPITVGPNHVEVPRERRLMFWGAWLGAFPAAMLRERTFTDYTLPHLFATVTACHGLWRYLSLSM